MTKRDQVKAMLFKHVAPIRCHKIPIRKLDLTIHGSYAPLPKTWEFQR